MPAETILAAAPETTVPGRDFGQPGSLPTGPGHDNHATYAILYGPDDEPTGWLRGGEALSAAWLTATAHGLSVLPLSGVIEVDHTRAMLSQLLAGVGYPYLVVRFGIPDAGDSGVPSTPRLPMTQVVEVGA